MSTKPQKPPQKRPGNPEGLSVALASKEVPPGCQNTYRVAFLGQSRVQAIRAFCLECQGFERAAVRNCDTHTCPLWRWRPYQSRRAEPGAKES